MKSRQSRESTCYGSAISTCRTARHSRTVHHPRFQEAVATVLAPCQRHQKVTGFLAGDIAAGRMLLDQGFRILAYGGDLWLYQGVLREGIAALQSHAK